MINKKYKTRNGLEVKLISTEGLDEFPVVGYTIVGEDITLRTWTAEGNYYDSGATSSLDLIEVKESTVFVNLYSPSEGELVAMSYSAENTADLDIWSDDFIGQLKIVYTKDRLVSCLVN